jgi:carboxyl-terminal processing protease
VLVLVNRYTASASEFLAGALQDYGRAAIVGDSRTYGKGICQTTYRLGRDINYGAIKVTNIAYYRVSGESPQCKGICPDILLPSPRIPENITASVALLSTNLPPVTRVGFAPELDLSPTISMLRKQAEKRSNAKAKSSVSIVGSNEDASIAEGLAILGDMIAIQQKEHLLFYREQPCKSLCRRLSTWLFH